MKLNMKNLNVKHVFIILLFLAGMVFYMNVYNKNRLEGFSGKKEECYDVLLKDGKRFLLFKKDKARIPGVNPVVFNNLEEYVEFLQYQRSQGVRCPILHFQKSYDSQNNAVIRRMSDPLRGNNSLGLNYPIPTTPLEDASRESEVFNRNLYPGFDPYNQTIGLNTPLDKMFRSKEIISDNAADTNWGGAKYSREQVDLKNKNKNLEQRLYERSIQDLNFFNDQQERMNALINEFEGSRYYLTRPRVAEPPNGTQEYDNEGDEFRDSAYSSEQEYNNDGEILSYGGPDGLYNEQRFGRDITNDSVSEKGS